MTSPGPINHLHMRERRHVLLDKIKDCKAQTLENELTEALIKNDLRELGEDRFLTALFNAFERTGIELIMRKDAPLFVLITKDSVRVEQETS